MAMGPQRRRRRSLSRWVLVGVLLSLVTVSVSVVSSAQTDGPARRFSELAYIDEMRPLIERSSAQGSVISQVRANGLRLGRDAVRHQLTRVRQEAGGVLSEAEKVEPPKSLATAHSVLIATMAVRARAAAAVDAAVTQAYAGGPPGPPVAALATAADQMAAADRTYQVFVESLPAEAGPRAVPGSRWLADPRPWDRAELAVFFSSLRASVTSAAVHDLGILAVTTKPPAVGSEGPAAVLPLVRSFRLEVVVANVGNSGVRGVPVVATLSGAAGRSGTARGVVDLEPSQRRTLTLNGLEPVAAGAATLRVVVGPVAGEANTADNERSQPVVLRAT